MATHRLVQSVEFFGSAWADRTPSAKFPHPERVVVVWADGSRDEFAPFFVASGASRDVLASSDTDYVLKVQDYGWHTRSNQVEHRLAHGVLMPYVPVVHGVASGGFSWAVPFDACRRAFS